MSKNSKERRAVVLAVISLNGLPAIPRWASWIAQDENGEWWAYETKPEIRLGNHEWERAENARRINTDVQQLVDITTLPKDWTKEIYRL